VSRVSCLPPFCLASDESLFERQINLLPVFHEQEEEEERKSVRSSSSMSANSHEKTTRHLQRQSTANSSRNYYYGEQRRRSLSASSSSSGSSRDPKERSRKHGARSKDSGFKSPHSPRTRTPNSNGSQQQIYSVSSKSKRSRQDRGATSPTPTTASAGQRSVRTTTTTLAAGLTDRPSSRNEILPKSSASRDKRRYATGSPDSGARSPSKVSKPPSPFQKLAKLFAPSSQKNKAVAT